MVFKKVEAWEDDAGFLHSSLEAAKDSYKRRRIMDLINEVCPITGNATLFQFGLELRHNHWLLSKMRELVVKLENEGLI